jgi:hypothetical protein
MHLKTLRGGGANALLGGIRGGVNVVFEDADGDDADNDGCGEGDDDRGEGGDNGDDGCENRPLTQCCVSAKSCARLHATCGTGLAFVRDLRFVFTGVGRRIFTGAGRHSFICGGCGAGAFAA